MNLALASYLAKLALSDRLMVQLGLPIADEKVRWGAKS
jgi:hypothetical protein